MHQQRVVAEVAPLVIIECKAGTANEVLVVPGDAGLQNPALHRDRPHLAVTMDKGVLQLWALAKYAVAFAGLAPSPLRGANRRFA